MRLKKVAGVDTGRNKYSFENFQNDEDIETLSTVKNDKDIESLSNDKNDYGIFFFEK